MISKSHVSLFFQLPYLTNLGLYFDDDHVTLECVVYLFVGFLWHQQRNK